MIDDAPLRVVLVEDDARYRESLELLFRHADDFEPVHVFGDAAAVCEHAASAKDGGCERPWDLVLMDIELPRVDGIEATRRLKAIFPDVPVVVLTVFEEPSTIIEAICAGADGYLLKKISAGELKKQLRAVAQGGSPLTPEVARSLVDVTRSLRGGRDESRASPAKLDLTPREQDVLRCLVDGRSYRDSADALGISPHTVRDHVRAIYRKLQVSNVAQAVTRAVRERLV